MMVCNKLRKISIINIILCLFLIMSFLTGCGETNSIENEEQQPIQIKIEITEENVSDYITFNVYNELIGTRPHVWPSGLSTTIYTFHTRITVRSKNTNYEFENVVLKFGRQPRYEYNEHDVVFCMVELDNKGDGHYESSLDIDTRDIYGDDSVFDATPKIIRSVNQDTDTKGYVYIPTTKI